VRATLSLLALVAACTVVLHDDAWRSPVARDHPLVGVIWDVAARRPIPRAALMRRGGNLLAFARMDGAIKVLSQHTATTKAVHRRHDAWRPATRPTTTS
jgi:hypothetical protein